MSARILDGKALAESILQAVRRAAASAPGGAGPCLVSLAWGEDSGARIYQNNQRKAAEKAGIRYRQAVLPRDARLEDFVGQLEALSRDRTVHGILIQRPLPEGSDMRRVFAALDPAKDVEGIHPQNLGALASGRPQVVPCTAEAALRLFRTTGLEPRGLEVVMVGHSEIVGKPIALLLLQELATVTVCHIGTRDLARHTREADLLFTAAGVPNLIRAEHVKKGAVVIDIGINAVKDAEGKTRIVGDVDFEAVRKKAGALTPVPGGVGPVTVAVLMENTWNAFRGISRGTE